MLTNWCLILGDSLLERPMCLWCCWCQSPSCLYLPLCLLHSPARTLIEIHPVAALVWDYLAAGHAISHSTVVLLRLQGVQQSDLGFLPVHLVRPRPSEALFVFDLFPVNSINRSWSCVSLVIVVVIFSVTCNPNLLNSPLFPGTPCRSEIGSSSMIYNYRWRIALRTNNPRHPSHL